MKQKRIHRAIVLVFMAITISCSKSSNSNTSTCTVSTGDVGPLTSSMQVYYAATVTNGATISSLTFQDSAGMTTVKNPTLPFGRSVNLQSGMTVAITASGTPNKGEISVASTGNSPNTASCP
jgi:hypothetical protein